MRYDSHVMMQKRPRIGITMRIEHTTDRFYLGRHYSEAVEAAGGTPLHMSLIPNADYIDSVVDGLDGILLPGSDSDVDPLRYGQEPHRALGKVQTIKDETDLLVIKAAERKGIPLLAICFGMQIVNVSRGGSVDAIVNSHHHQAIESLGADLVATAWTTDGIIEALEDPRPDRFIVAVQWHPELGWEKDLLSQRLFRVFVDEAANVRQAELASVSTPA